MRGKVDVVNMVLRRAFPLLWRMFAVLLNLSTITGDPWARKA